MLRARARGEHRRRRLEFADRAAGILQDGYDEAKMIDAVRFCWQGRKQSTEPYLRTAVDFLLAHNVLLRSEFRLAAEFPDFFTIPLPGEGPTPCFPMIMIMDNGKMNPQGRLEYGGGDAAPESRYSVRWLTQPSTSFTGGTSPARPPPAFAGASSGTASTSAPCTKVVQYQPLQIYASGRCLEFP